MEQRIYNGLGLLGVGLTVISLRSELTVASWGWWVMVIAGLLILCLSPVEIFFGKKEV